MTPDLITEESAPPKSWPPEQPIQARAARGPAIRAIRYLATRQAGLIAAVLSLCLGLVWASAISPLDAPDEPAHLQAIMEVRNKHRLPEVHYDFSVPHARVIGEAGDQAARDYAISLGYGAPYALIPYESIQPPLYYLAAGLLAYAAPPDPHMVLYLGRLVAVLFGAATVYFCWAAVRELAPHSPVWAAAVAGVVLLLPQFCFNSATAGNDSAVNFASAACFYVWFRGLRQPAYDPRMVRAGALLGLALLSKLTAVALVPGLALVLVFRALQSRHDGDGGDGGDGGTNSMPAWARTWRRGLPMLTGAAGAALLVSGWWFVRNMITYGEFTGNRDSILFYKANFAPISFDLASSRSQFLSWTWQSFWGLFGWMHIRMPDEYYGQAALVAGGLVVLSALAVVLITRRGTASGKQLLPRHVRQAAFVMEVVAVTLVAGYLSFNFTVAGAPQARYLFPLLLPIALLLTGGLYALAPGRVKAFALSMPALWLGVMNFVGLTIVSIVV